MFYRTGGRPDRTGMRQIAEKDIEAAFGRDSAITNDTEASEAALSPLEDSN